MLLLILAVAGAWAEPVPAPERPLTKTTAKKRHFPFKWLRRIGAAEVGLAMRLSGAGIPDPDRPAPSNHPVVAEANPASAAPPTVSGRTADAAGRAF